MLPKPVWKQHVGMHLPCMLFSLEICLTCLHTLCTPLGQDGSFLRSVNTLGRKKREKFVCPLTTHWAEMNLPWNPCRQTTGCTSQGIKMSRPTKVLASKTSPDLHGLYGDQHKTCRTQEHQSEGKKKIGPSAQVLSSGYFESPCVSSTTAHNSLASLKLERNGRRVQCSFVSSTLCHCYCPKAELQTTNWETTGWQQEDEPPGTDADACMFVPRKLFKVKFSPCWGKQRNSLASVYSNPSLIENGKLSSCLKDPEDVWPICPFIYFFNFLLCFVTANRHNKYHSVKEKQGIDTLGWSSAWIYKNLLWFGSLNVP